MQISAEGRIGIWLALIGLAGAGATIVAPDHTEIGWLLIATALIGGALLAGHHFANPKRRRRKMVAIIGMVVCALGLLGFGTMYLLSRAPLVAASTHPSEVPKDPRLSIGCYQEILPKTIPADESIQVLQLFPLPIENGAGL
jgi:hypothetical protein